ncbi:MAG: radical SAM family heme chaperone HemW [Thermoanaerobaculia bacterium]
MNFDLAAESGHLGLYVHLPFCRIRCSYCPFAISTDLSLEEAYVRALVSEIALRRAERARVETLYFGGGTPSRLSAGGLEKVVAAIRGAYQLQDGLEFSLEANPEDVDEEAVERWKTLGIDRVSIGVQSFHDPELFPLGRGHGRTKAIEALRVAVRSGLRVNVDLMIGLPHQTRRSFEESLRIAIDEGAGHLSLYILDLEVGTALEKQVRHGRTALPEDELTAELYLHAIEESERRGLRHYEISNFARAGEESRHNLKYWQREHYLGVGLGSHSFVGEERFANTREVREYIARLGEGKVPTVFSESLGEEEQRRERIFLSLRQTAGIGYAELIELTGREGTEWTRRGTSEGWLQQRGDRVGFTPSGFLLSNEYISQLF